MAARTPLILNQATARVEELAVVDFIPGALIGGMFGRNLIVNGNFDFWQRRDTYTQSSNGQGYCADRWVVAAANCTHQAQRNVNIPGDGPHPGVISFHRSNVTGVSSVSSAYIGQYIENVQTLADRDAVVSFYMYGPPSGAKVGVRLIQSFGTGGSAIVSKELGVFQLPASGWAKVELTGKLSSLAGKTIGANSSLYLVIDYCATAALYGGALVGQTGVFGISRVQLEEGTAATPFEQRHDAVELALCQRYYQKSYPITTAPGSNTNEGRYVWGNGLCTNQITRLVVPFKATMRAAPAVTVYGAPTGAAGTISQADGSNVSGVAEAIGQGAFNAAWNNNNGQWGGWFHWTADAEF